MGVAPSVALAWWGRRNFLIVIVVGALRSIWVLECLT